MWFASSLLDTLVADRKECAQELAGTSIPSACHTAPLNSLVYVVDSDGIRLPSSLPPCDTRPHHCKFTTVVPPKLAA